MNKLMLLTPLLLLMLMGIAGASAPVLPSGTQYYVNITIGSWASVHSTNVQQMLIINMSKYSSYLNTTPYNIRFTYPSGGNVHSWVEDNFSSTTKAMVVWVNITNTTTQIEMDIGAKTTNWFNNTWDGLAPQLSSTYAEYDDGASVFSYYENFAGTTAPSGWTTYGTSGTVTYNNGLTQVGANAQGGVTTTSNYTVLNSIVEWYGNIQTVEAAEGAEVWGETGVSSQTIGTSVAYGNQYMLNWENNNTGVSDGFGQGTVNNIVGISVTSTTSAVAYYNDEPQTQSLSGQPALTTSTKQWSEDAYGNATTVFIQWWRIRAQPPNGVMPSVSFGSVQLTHPILSISPNPATYGQQITISALCASGDSCAIDYPSLGTAIATGTGSATYTYNAFALGAGTYSSFYANDITQGTNSTPVTLTINKASVSPSCSFAGASIANDTTQQSFAAQNYLNCTMPNHNSQLTVNLYYNGSIVTSGNTISYLTKFDNYNNSFTYNTIGNTNYTAGSFIGHIDYLLYKLISATNLGPTAYETATVNPQYTLNITKAAVVIVKLR